MAITSLAASQTAYQRTNQLQNVRNPPTRPEKGDGSPVGNGMGVSKADFLTISDPVAFANQVLQDKVVNQLNAYLAETPNTELIGNIDPNRVTPEGTAKFIVDMATSFYGAYAENHKEDGDQAKLDGFMNLIRGGIDKGFEEARGILDALKVLDFGTVSQDIDTTYDLVQKGLDDFYQQQKAMINKGSTAATTDAAAQSFGAMGG